MTFPRNYF